MFQSNAIICHIAINWAKLFSLIIIKNIRKIRYRTGVRLANGFSRS